MKEQIFRPRNYVTILMVGAVIAIAAGVLTVAAMGTTNEPVRIAEELRQDRLEFEQEAGELRARIVQAPPDSEEKRELQKELDARVKEFSQTLKEYKARVEDLQE